MDRRDRYRLSHAIPRKEKNRNQRDGGDQDPRDFSQSRGAARGRRGCTTGDDGTKHRQLGKKRDCGGGEKQFRHLTAAVRLEARDRLKVSTLSTLAPSASLSITLPRLLPTT